MSGGRTAPTVPGLLNRISLTRRPISSENQGITAARDVNIALDWLRRNDVRYRFVLDIMRV